MNIKNTVSLTIDEAVALLSKIATSLNERNEFAFDLKGQEVSIEAGKELLAKLSISPEQFSIIFDWSETEEKPSKEEKQVAKEVQVQEESIPDSPQPETPMSVEELKTEKPMRRALPKRMTLKTTTLPLEGGFWSPAFKENGESQWREINIDAELENQKWATDDQITTLSDLTPSKAKPKTKRKRNVDDDDLFSELDSLDEDSKRKTKPASTPKRTSSLNDKKSADPAGSSIGKKSTSPPPTPSQTQEEIEDEWVKPSEVLKKKAASGIPKPGSGGIPKPETQKSSSSSSKNIPQPKPEDDDEVYEWKEPSREDISTGDDWVKPSEFLKGDKSSEKEEIEEKKNRPPPKAPDAKKDEKDKKKGWASWD